MTKKAHPAPTGAPAENPMERLRASQIKLDEIRTSLRNVVRDIEAANLALLDGAGLDAIDSDSRLDPLSASERIEGVLAALAQVEEQAKDNSKEAREAGKLAEHLSYAVRSLYREVLARGEAERVRQREYEASRQKPLFPSTVEVGGN